MELKDKLKIENPDEKVIRMYKEGLFFVAYNYSALRFKTFFAPKVKILKHELKNGSWYLRIGISENSVMLDGIPVKDENGKYKIHVEIASPELENKDLERIIPDLVITKYKKEEGKKDTNNNNREKKIIAELSSLNLAVMTPMQALTAINNWQQALKDTDTK